MIIPEDDSFPPVTTSNLNHFNDIMVIKGAESWKHSGETTFQLSTLNRSRGLSGWPADRFFNEVLHDHETVVESIREERKEINLDIDTSALRPEFERINYGFKRNHQNPSPKNALPRPNFNARFASNNNPRSWKEKPWEPLEPPLPFDPPVKKKNLDFPRKVPGLLGDCPVARIPPNGPGGSLLPFPRPYPDFPLLPPPRENQRHSLGVYDSAFEGMEPLKNFTCTKRDSRLESAHPYRGSYPRPGKIKGPRLINTSEEPFNQYTDTERVEPGSSYMYNNSYNNRNEAPQPSHISPNRNFRNQPDNSYVGPEMDNVEFSQNFRPEHPFENQHEGFNNERLLNNGQQSAYPRKSWQGNRKFAPIQKQNFKGGNNAGLRRKKNSYFSFYRRPWSSPMRASPMRAQNSSFRKNRRF